jgi:hypothetical protein
MSPTERIQHPAEQAAAGAVLLPLARAAIARALNQPAPAVAWPGWLDEPGASFVTLTQHGALRGCIGSLQAHRALGADVQANAIAAALHDTRFAPLRPAELAHTTIEVSLLSAPQDLPAAADESDALAQLRPGIDGVVLQFGALRSTFLPQVWQQLPEPAQFLAQLKRKAGLPADFWHPQLKLQRYTVRKWAEGEPALAT